MRYDYEGEGLVIDELSQNNLSNELPFGSDALETLNRGNQIGKKASK